MRDCSVCECPDNEFPEIFKKVAPVLPADDLKCQEGRRVATVDRTLDSKIFRGWAVVDNPWTNDDETDNGLCWIFLTILLYFCVFFSQLNHKICSGFFFPFSAEMTYVNLQLNPERYTGYTGPSARRIWEAIYTENCPKG